SLPPVRRARHRPAPGDARVATACGAAPASNARGGQATARRRHVSLPVAQGPLPGLTTSMYLGLSSITSWRVDSTTRGRHETTKNGRQSSTGDRREALSAGSAGGDGLPPAGGCSKDLASRPGRVAGTLMKDRLPSLAVPPRPRSCPA